MRAAVCHAFGEPLSVEEISIAAPERGEVRVTLAACAICQSDIHYLEGAWGGTLPAVYGHEAAGIVELVGDGVEGIRPGDHVVVTLIRSCGSCDFCDSGQPVLCDTTFPLDRQSPLASLDGAPIAHGLRTAAFADQVVVDASQVVVIPEHMPLDRAALLACGVITGFGAVVNTARVEPGSSVVVIGTGGVGLNAVQGAVFAGATTVIGIDPAASKRDAARIFGATDTLDPTGGDAVADVAALTDGRKADYVIVTVGAQAAVELGPLLLRRGGTMVIVGMPAAGVTASLDPGTIANEGQRILGSKMGATRVDVDIPRLVALHEEGRLKLDELISGRYPLEQINEAIASVASGTTIRNLIVFDRPEG